MFRGRLPFGDDIEMVAAPEIVGTTRGILGWEAELIITKPVGGASSLVYYRPVDKYQEPFRLPANWRDALETQRYSSHSTETVIIWRMGLYLATGIGLYSKIEVGQISIRKG